MLQSLSAKVEVDLESRVDFVNFNKEINMLDKKLQSVNIDMQSQKNRARQEKLYWKKRQLVSEKFSKWQKIQTHKVIVKAENDTSSIASRPPRSSSGPVAWSARVFAIPSRFTAQPARPNGTSRHDYCDAKMRGWKRWWKRVYWFKLSSYGASRGKTLQ